ncbi:hypothetical protein HDU98_003092 [Podochytrium sp. JEL0797]|nr:hypothetical protein HDU98_003092 [Podochytrium sp. JEL0797]
MTARDLEYGTLNTETEPLLRVQRHGSTSTGSSHDRHVAAHESATSIHTALQSGFKTPAQIATIKQSIASRSQANAVADFYASQNEMIEQLLRPVEDDSNEALETANLVKVKIALYGSLMANLLLFALQLFAATTSGSLSLFATMSDSFMDLASNLVLIGANLAASKRNPQGYPAGKQRFETAGIVVFSCIMGALSVQLMVEGGKALVRGEAETDINFVNMSCIAFAVALKIALYVYCYALRQYPTANVLAQDHRNDIILNVTGIAFSLLGKQVQWWIDPVGGIVIAIWILISWEHTAIEHIQMFVGRSAPPLFLNRITYIAMTHHIEILEVDTVRAYSSGAGYFVEVDVVMDPMCPLQKSHDIAESLQNKIEMLDGVDRAFVHMDYESVHAPEHSY